MTRVFFLRYGGDDCLRQDSRYAGGVEVECDDPGEAIVAAGRKWMTDVLRDEVYKVRFDDGNEVKYRVVRDSPELELVPLS